MEEAEVPHHRGNRENRDYLVDLCFLCFLCGEDVSGNSKAPQLSQNKNFTPNCIVRWS